MKESVANEIHWHDSVIREVRILHEPGIVELTIDYPIDWESEHYEQRIVHFSDASGYKEYEGPFVGCPTILDVSHKKDEDWLLVRIDTNAGYRELLCKSIRLLPVARSG